MVTVLFDGVAYGMLLFLLASGLALTLRLMNFVNLAHGVLAMVGGYVTVVLTTRSSVPFLVALPVAFLVSACLGFVLQRLLYARYSDKSLHDQVLVSIGLMFVVMSAADYILGSSRQFPQLPEYLQGIFNIAGVSIGRYRLLVIVICGILAARLQDILVGTALSSRLRTGVKSRHVGPGLSIDFNMTFVLTFAAGLAGLFGALGVEMVGLDPTLPLRYLIYLLFIVTISGTATISGLLRASLLLGTADVAGKYYVPEFGSFIIYGMMVVILLIRPQGLFVAAADEEQPKPDIKLPLNPSLYSGTPSRWRTAETMFWLAAGATYFLLPDRHLILNEIAIMALFAMSLDIVMGFAGILSLGHAAFLGMGAYAAGLFAKHINPDPLIGLAMATAASVALGFISSFLVLRGSDLTRLTITLGVMLFLGQAANQMEWLTGGADGLQGIQMAPILGWFHFDMFGLTAYGYSLVTLFVLFVVARCITNSPFGLSLMEIRNNPFGAGAVDISANRLLIAAYTLGAAYAGAAGALLAQTSQFVSLDLLSFERSVDVMVVLVIGGAGYLYGGILGAIGFKLLQDWLSAMTPQYWHFWIGMILVALVHAGWGGLGGAAARVLGLGRKRAAGAAPRAGEAEPWL